MQFRLQFFEDNEHDEFRVIDVNGTTWFVLNEVCKKLEIRNSNDVARRLDDEDKMALDISDPHGRIQRTTVINESGLYSLILTSRKPNARKFKRWVTSEVLPSLRKTGSFGKTPAFIKRANDNWNRVDQGYFSVINELAVLVWGRLEREGHILADKSPGGIQIRPDVSVGSRFAKWLDQHHPTVCSNYRVYKHITPEAEIDARQYPNSMLALFREYIEEIWWPDHFESYVKNRDPVALQYIPRLLPPKTN